MSKFMFKVAPQNPELGSVTPYTIKSKCNYLRRHFDRIEKVYQEETEELWKDCQAEQERTKDHEDDSEHDYSYSDALREIEFISLRMHRYSAILASYAYLENSMSKLCTKYHDSMDLPLKPAEVTGDGIVKFKLYLERLAKIDFQAVNKQWSHLCTLNLIRNCVVHADGDANLIKQSRKLIDIINSSKELSFIEEQLIMMDASYIHSTIDTIESFLLHLFKIGR
ncbi:hypothetical protein PS673_02035 [Pseudomonas fluorescens]|jgi:hypothetical protein|uniref:RiboL-PSP-HEPN domain-containing protein n=1 Tax=Pseudomonas fluorescens TaxID=294 RepID=A0A5E6S6H7_PSEFL|nr:hypothetical protein [Pseudomonas fluorescens]VVM76191.1 hypothetical protein PS673_02035 [Pseudomonas fluorescens]